MKRFLCLLFFAIFIVTAEAQPFNNLWIDYNKTYYKFKVGPFGFDIVGAPVKKGIVRITQPELAGIGLSAVPAEQFQCWRDGQEVPVFVSKISGILTATDYIEFFGEIANGEPDKDLYKDSSYQLSDYWSLETDSATYFLTVNAASNNKRFVLSNNVISSVTIQPEKNFLYTAGRYYRGYLNEGFGVFVEQNLYSSSYELGEGFTSRPVRNNNSYLGQPQMPQGFAPLYADTTSSTMTANFAMVGNGPYMRDVKILLNDDSLIQFSMGYFLSQKLTVPNIAVNRIENDAATFIIQNLSTVPEDELRVATIELEYARLFNFGDASNFEFNIHGSSEGRYLKITNFNKGTGTAILYDLTNNKRYIADTAIADTLQFFLPPSAEPYHLALVRGDGSTAQIIHTLQLSRFTNFTEAANQGNYLIITNPALYGTGTDNYVQRTVISEVPTVAVILM